jgi:hypothetical protein
MTAALEATPMNDDELDSRLAALEARAPAAGLPPALSDTRPVRRRFGPLGLVAAGLTLVLAATAVAGGVVLEGLRATEGVQNPGQPLHGARMECLSPPDAEVFLAGKGFRNVVWQVESGSSKDGRSVQQRTAPEHGYVVPGAIVDDTLYMVVDQREDATGSGACFQMKMP